jgi:hypothetical protein
MRECSPNRAKHREVIDSPGFSGSMKVVSCRRRNPSLAAIKSKMGRI